MARITYVKAARQRYATVPVMDPETGEQKKTPVMVTRKIRHDNGEMTEVVEQKKTKHGTPVFMKVTEADKDQPLPNYICEHCKQEIKVGDSYKHVTPKSGPYGGRTRQRCSSCPSWQSWDLSNSLSARVEEIVYNAEQGLADAEDDDEVVQFLSDTADSIRELAEEKREAAENIREGFGHDTSMSEELDETADSLETWADEVEGAWDDSKFDRDDHREEPDEPDEDDDDDGEKGEDGEDEGDTPKTEDEIEAEITEKWREEVENEVGSVLGNSPV